MGLAFVVVVMALAGLVLGTFGAVVLGLLAFGLQRRCGGDKGRWVAAFSLFPYVALLYGALMVASYGAWCIGVRHVDPGIGDGFELPLRNGYSFQAIDTTERAFIQGPGGQQSWVQRIGAAGPYLFGEGDSSQYFLLDTRSGTQWSYPSEAELDSRLHQFGVRSTAITSPDSFYYGRRWNLLDLLFGLLLVGVPASAFIGLSRWFIQDLRRRRAPGEPGSVYTPA